MESSTETPTARFISGLTSRHVTVSLCLIALIVRLAVLFVWHDHLHEDRDAYVGIAKQVAAGNGFSNVSGQPTAFRPPLYPVLLSVVYRFGGGPIAVGILQLILGCFTVWLVVKTTAFVRPRSVQILAGLIVALDPLLVLYTTFVMTEVTMAALFAVLMYCHVRFKQQPGNSEQIPGRTGWRQPVTMGLLFGACALCRPSVWPFGALAIGWWWIGNSRRDWKYAAGVAIGVGVLIVPWTIRNANQIGKPVFATTHGGYTLHLANNNVFYNEVVQKPWGTTWRGDSLNAWNDESHSKMRVAKITAGDEPAIDRWHRQQAFVFMRANPVGFLKGCGLRFLRFWSPIPNTTSSSAGTPRAVVWAVGLFYGFVLVGLVLFVFRTHQKRWAIGFGLLLVSFSIVHSVFWSNARMRAPLVPAIAILSACGWCGSKKSASDSELSS